MPSVVAELFHADRSQTGHCTLLSSCPRDAAMWLFLGVGLESNPENMQEMSCGRGKATVFEDCLCHLDLGDCGVDT